MKKHNKILITLIIMTLILSTLTFANSTKKTIEVLFNTVKLTVNGQKVEADTIAFNGTTYVPLRAIGEMLDKEVLYESETMTAHINDKMEKKEPAKGETLAQSNAIRKAKDYLELMAFSKSRLKRQLEHDGFSEEDSEYAVERIDVDWKEQAYKKGQSYLDIMAFSRDKLIKQLEHDGFTKEEAIYALDKIGL